MAGLQSSRRSACSAFRPPRHPCLSHLRGKRRHPSNTVCSLQIRRSAQKRQLGDLSRSPAWDSILPIESSSEESIHPPLLQETAVRARGQSPFSYCAYHRRSKTQPHQASEHGESLSGFPSSEPHRDQGSVPNHTTRSTHRTPCRIVLAKPRTPCPCGLPHYRESWQSHRLWRGLAVDSA